MAGRSAKKCLHKQRSRENSRKIKVLEEVKKAKVIKIKNEKKELNNLKKRRKMSLLMKSVAKQTEQSIRSQTNGRK